jgi:ecdysone receptor
MVFNITTGSCHSPGDPLDFTAIDDDVDMWAGEGSNQTNFRVKSEPEEGSPCIQPPTFHGQKVKRKGAGVAGKSIEEELCLICGDKASGYHYNALSCEGCKGFFRRSVTRGATYVCKNGGQCEMDMWMRRRCQYCRLRRCKEVGMKEECLLSDDQCKARDARRKARQKLIAAQSGDEVSQQSPDSNTHPQASVDMPGVAECSPLELLPRHHREVIKNIVLYQDKFELPDEEDVQRVTEVKISDSTRPKDVSEMIFKQMAGMTILVTQLVVEFAKHLPGFTSLEREDQIILLKGCALEVMMIRTARRYDLQTDTIVFANGMPYTKDNLFVAGLRGYVDSMFKFCRGMGELQVDNAEYAMLTAICILSERPGLKEPGRVEEFQSTFVESLQAYDAVRRQKCGPFFAKLLMKLTELRTLSSEYTDVLFNLKIERGSLPPLLSEFFDCTD